MIFGPRSDLRNNPEFRTPCRAVSCPTNSARSTTAIALWNTTYIQAALDQLTREGWDISQADIARVSPLAFRHINFLGRYAFDLPKAVAEGALRPLRNPNSEWDIRIVL